MTKNLPEIDEFDIFEERVKALLIQWRSFKTRQPNFNPTHIVANCIAEICDDISKDLIVKEEAKNFPFHRRNIQLVGLITSEIHGVTKGKRYNCTSELSTSYVVQLDSGVYGCRPKDHYRMENPNDN